MFKLAFHGGPAVEVFSPQGKNPLENWKITGNVQKSFDKEVKGSVWTLEGQSKIQLPNNDKDFLGLI